MSLPIDMQRLYFFSTPEANSNALKLSKRATVVEAHNPEMKNFNKIIIKKIKKEER
jgi:hypothetical protein